MRRAHATFAALALLVLACKTEAAAGAVLEIISPHGGEVFVIGQTQQVRVQTKIRSTISVDISRNGGATFEAVGSIDPLSKTASRDSLNFPIVGPGSPNCVIRVRASAPKGEVLSIGNAFTITSAQNLYTTASVTSESLAQSAVGTIALADGSVTTPKLADASVNSIKISSGNASSQFVLTADGSGGASWLAIPGLPDGSVGLEKLNTASVDGRYVLKAGDTMTGNLKLPLGGPVADEDAATKKYVDIGVTSVKLPATAIVLSETNTPLNGFTLLPGTIKNDSVWKKSTALSSARQVAAAAIVNGKIYLIGGFDGSYLTNNNEFDPGTQTWTSKAAMPTPRNGMAIAVVNNKIYVIGGYNGAEVSVNEVYDPQNDSWTTKAPMPTARELMGFGEVGNKIYVIGGSANSVTQSANEEYDTVLDSWTTKSPLPTPRYGIGSDVYSGRIFLIGGRNAGGTHFGTNEAYDPSNNSWQTFAPMPTPRQSLSATLIGSKIYCVGGKDSSAYLGTNEAYDVIGDSWSSRLDMPTPRYRHAAVVLSGILHVMGGFDGVTYSLHQLFDPSQPDDYFLQKKN